MNFYSQVILSFFHKDHTGWKMSVSCIRQAPYSLGVQMWPQQMKAQPAHQLRHIRGTWSHNDHHAFSSVYRESTGSIQNSGDFNSRVHIVSLNVKNMKIAYFHHTVFICLFFPSFTIISWCWVALGGRLLFNKSSTLHTWIVREFKFEATVSDKMNQYLMACPVILPSRLAVCLLFDVSDGLWLMSSITSQGLSVRMTLEDHILVINMQQEQTETERKRGGKGKGRVEKKNIYLCQI